MPKILAILVSDVHLCHTPPPARAGEPSWYEAMRRPLSEIAYLARKHRCPVIYAGDIFDRWGPPIELVNFAIDHLPRGYAVYGQHDMPNHAVEEFDRTAYATLIRAGVIENIAPGEHVHTPAGELVLHGFPWGVPIEPMLDPYAVHVAVAHRYIWTKGHTYHEQSANVQHTPTGFADALKGYHVAHFGDNHSGFIAIAGECWVANCGTLMRRRSDEVYYKPWVGLIREDYSVEQHFLDTSADVFEHGVDPVVSPEAETLRNDIQNFMAGLATLQHDSLDFRAVVDAALASLDVSDGCRARVMSAMEVPCGRE